MAGTTTANWWQYSRWAWIIARTYKLNSPDDTTVIPAVGMTEQDFLSAFCDYFYNPATQGGTRPWLAVRMNCKSANYDGTNAYDDGVPNIVKMVGVIARDLKRIPLTVAEQTYVDNLITVSGNRRYGDKGNLI